MPNNQPPGANAVKSRIRQRVKWPDQSGPPKAPQHSHKPRQRAPKRPASGEQHRPIVVTSPKSVGIAIIVAGLFGPLGLFYATVWGGIIMSVVSFFVAILTLGFGLLLMWPVCMIWAAIAAHLYNEKLRAG